MNQSFLSKLCSNRTFVILIAGIVTTACSGPEDKTDPRPKESQNVDPDTLSEILVDSDTTQEFNTDVYSAASVFSEEIGWGYQILLNGKPYINQPHIPAISGVKGFDSEADALKTAELGIYKIEQGFFPPTISEKELDSLGVLD